MSGEKEKLIEIICGNTNKEKIFNNLNWIIETIPEVKPMINMEQNNPYHCFTVWEHTVESILNIRDNEVLRLTMLFHDIGKPLCYKQDENEVGHFYGHPQVSAEMASVIMKRFLFDDEIISTVTTLVYYHDAEIPSKSLVVSRWLNKLGEYIFKLLIEVKRADAMAQSEKFKNEKFIKIDKLENRLKEIIEQRKQFSKRDLNINGRDLIDIGVENINQIGIILNTLVEMVSENIIENNKEDLIKTAKYYLEKSNK